VKDMKILAGIDEDGNMFKYDVSNLDNLKKIYADMFREQNKQFNYPETLKKHNKLNKFLKKMMNAENEEKFLHMAEKVSKHIEININIVKLTKQ
jgi:hypothetical protein